MLEQQRLKELLHYDPETGHFTYRVTRGRMLTGMQAGNLDPKGYVHIQIDFFTYKAHRLAFLYMIGKFPSWETDHKNRRRADNRWVNLREVSPSTNAKNKGLRKDNTSGVVGVHWHKTSQKWYASISSSGKRISLGFFVDLSDAITARLAAEVEYNFHPSHGGI